MDWSFADSDGAEDAVECSYEAFGKLETDRTTSRLLDMDNQLYTQQINYIPEEITPLEENRYFSGL